MKSNIKHNFVCAISSDGSLRFLPLSSHYSKQLLNSKSIDTINHPAWTGKRPKEQTEISAFLGRLDKGIKK